MRLHRQSQVLNWGTILAMLAPDTRDHHLFLEPTFFWLYHVLLLTLPLTWLARRRFNVYKVRFAAMTSRTRVLVLSLSLWHWRTHHPSYSVTNACPSRCGTVHP